MSELKVHLLKRFLIWAAIMVIAFFVFDLTITQPFWEQIVDAPNRNAHIFIPAFLTMLIAYFVSSFFTIKQYKKMLTLCAKLSKAIVELENLIKKPIYNYNNFVVILLYM